MTQKKEMPRGKAPQGQETDYDIRYNNLAVPEVLTGKAEKKKAEEARPDISYSTAVPEIHNIRRKIREVIKDFRDR